MREHLRSKRTDFKVRKVLKQLTQITEKITKVVSREHRNPELDAYSEVFKRVAAAKPPVYLGKEDPASLENWIREFDKLFDAINCPSEMRVNNGVYYLREEADLWWAQRKYELLKRPNFGWDEFKEALREKFYPSYLRKQKCMEFTNLRMGNMSIIEYYNKFIDLMRFALEVVPTETIKAQRFEQGLTLTLQGKLGGVTFETLNEVYGRATHLYGIKGREMEQKLGHREYECFKKEADVKFGKVKESSAPSKPPQSSGPTTKAGTSSGAGGASKGRVFVMNSRQDESANDVVIGVFFLSSSPVKVFFDSGASHSFISKEVVGSLGLESPELVSLHVSIPSGEVRSCSRLFLSVPISISEVKFLADLIEFDLNDFDVILGMDWLGKYEAKIVRLKRSP
ncbi:uncharacterized protein LOC110713411 [Chenopodium quinoa]|uniref:uncharacterized protein LOC110713411 n=1 Tax=Chenopodium quinoa TaxID=63459 RepID=UPI000B796738|nr:uncharacterized protein LOC110713411 [Chenopodium quinoa]